MKKVIKQSYQTNIEVESFTVNNITISQHNIMTSDEVVVEKIQSPRSSVGNLSRTGNGEIEFAVGFAEWKDKTGYIKIFSDVSGFKSLFRDGRNFEDAKEYTYNDLIQLYINSTTNGK